MLEVTLRHGFAAAGRQDGFVLDAAFAAPGAGITALFGPSGAGKSSVLAAVAGLLRPREGRIAIGGAVVLDTAARRFVPPEQRHCGVVFQDARLFPHLNVATNLRYGARRARGRDTPDGPGFDEVVDLLGIAGLLARRPGGLSGGERQRVALGRALLSRPRLLLMDEPLASLDAPRRGEAMGLFERVRDAFGVPILYVTHALDEVDRLADMLVLMEAGRVVATGPLEALSARTDLPLAGRRDAGSVIAGRIEAQDAARGLTRIGFDGGTLLVPLRAGAPGERVRVRIRARDIALALARPEAISINNILAVRVEAVDPAGPHEVFLRLAVGPTRLVARITRESAGKLGLAPGAAAFALIKSVAFDHAGGA
jgi:molybdate transport system ATP-binding protein